MRGPYRAVFAVVLAVVLSWPARSLAGTYEEGKTAFLRKDYEAAFAIWRPIADKDPRAQARLAQMYLGGLGVVQNFKLALIYAGKAADRGNARAQYTLGVMYRDGRGEAQDLEKASLMFRKAADQDFAWAQHDLGLIYYLGEGVPTDLIEAYRWIALAAISRPDDDQEAETTSAFLLEEVGAKLTQEQLREAKERLRHWQGAHIR
jgi:uncharacterized protein